MILNQVGEITNSIPIVGLIDLINYDTQTITELVCHHDEWIINDSTLYNASGPLARTANVPINSSEPRTFNMLFGEYELKLGIFGEMLNSLNYSRSASRYTDVLNDEIFVENQNFINNPILNYNLEIATIDSDFPVINPSVGKMINGVFALSYASRSRIVQLNNLDRLPTTNPSNPCLDVNLTPQTVGQRDGLCKYRNECMNTRKRFIPNLLIYSEVTSFHRDLWSEDKIEVSLPWYRLDYYIRNNLPVQLNNIHGILYVGQLVNNTQNAFTIQLLSGFSSSSLERGKDYEFPLHSPIYGPYQEARLLDYGNNILEFRGQVPLLIGRTIIFMQKIDPYRNLNLINRMISNLKSGISFNKIPDVNDPNFVQEFIMREAQKGGKRTAQATFGGWGDFS